MFSANDFPYLFRDELIDRLSFPQIWQERSVSGLGEYAAWILWGWPVDFLYGVLGFLGFDFVNIQILLFFLPYSLIGFISAKKLFKYFGLSGWVLFVSIFFYLVNTYTILLIDGGQFSIALAYSLFPGALYILIRSFNNFSFSNALLTGLTISILGIFDIRYLFIFVICTFLYLTFYRPNFVTSLKSLAVIGIIFVCTHSFWIGPVALSKIVSLPETYGRSAQVENLSLATIKHVLFAYSPHWYKNIFGNVSQPFAIFIIIPILAFLAPIFNRKNKNVAFWLLVSIVAILLVKGNNEPLNTIYLLLFEKIPGFSLFRDPTKFFVLLNLSYALLIGFTTKYLSIKYKSLAFAIFIYFLILMAPVWMGRMTGALSIPRYHDDFVRISEILSKDKYFGRLVWIPSRPSMGFASSIHPNLELLRLLSVRPYAIGIVGTYETQNFFREFPLVGELLKISGVKYLAYPYPDIKRNPLTTEQKYYFYSFLDQIKKQPWIKKVVADKPVNLLEINEYKDRFFMTHNTYFVVGSDRIYWDLAKIKDFDLSDNVLVFTEEKPGILSQIENYPNAKILNYEKHPLDIQLAGVDIEKFIFPAINLSFEPSEGQTGWWKRETSDLIWWKYFLQQKYNIYNLDFDYGGGWAVAEGNLELTIESKQFKVGETLYARVMESHKGGQVSFYQDDNLIGSVDTKIEKPEKITEKLTGYKETPDQMFEYDEANVRWFEVGRLQSDTSVRIVASGDINVVNSLVAINNSDLDDLDYEEFKISSFSGNSSASNSNAKIRYTRIAPTHYKVKVEGLESPSTLVFSETFDPFWELNGQKSTKVYSFLNGFYIEKDGEYDLYFEPQKYVLPGLVISLITLGVVIVLIRRK